MMTRSPHLVVVALFACVVTRPVAAQDGFGAAVWAPAADEILVLKPAFGRGPASVLVFGKGDSGWSQVQEVWSAGSLLGESFGRTMAPVEGGFLAASGDPQVMIGAYGFARGADGGWAESGALPLGAAAGAAPEEMSMGRVMAILQPPARVVAADRDVALVSAPGGRGAGTEVRVYVRGTDGTWSAAGLLEAGDLRANARYGAALAVRGGLAAVGAPGQGSSGTVYVFARGADGAWSREAALDSPALGGGAGLGASVLFTGDGELAVGAPNADGSVGRVVLFAGGAEGDWAEAATLLPGASGPGQRFGAALAAAGDELIVGAPGAEDGRGRVDAFSRADADGEWRAGRSFAPEGAALVGGFGSALALRPGLAVVGSPESEGSAGLAAVYEAAEDGSWSGPVWLRPGSPPAAVTSAEVRCEDDRAAGFDCADVDLQAYLPLASIGGEPGERVSDAWGWTDPETGREYGLVGRSGGAAIVDVTDAVNPVYLGVIPANRSGARDLKVYADHLFFTGDGAGAHGLVVFDLTRLRDVASPPVEFAPDLRWDGIGSAHNLIIDTGAGTAFTVSTSGDGHTCGGGLVMIDIRQPLAPEFAGCYTDTEGLIFQGRTHDAQCLVYDGPDMDYRGRELCFASNETALRIVDVTDKSNPRPISAAAYPGVAYIHQGWLSDDRRYFFLDDELDELVGTTDRTKTIVWDVTDLDDPVVIADYYGPNNATDHNLYVKGDRMYQANYQAGFRVIDISDPENLREVGYFDTTPYGADPPGFNGAWTAFPYFESGTVLVTSMLEGVFLLKPRRTELVP
ncbi:choice-of-anchor B family protein [Candidatus Palauibacter soopunensis]|uniref:choice-of-anchor B family protein n=1 Tax=Candidatus Palauibacter soopunensis TaxID=3056739 RepID=UPI0023931DC6|nr:choice-of-anchor B family protein [Candidatus Palauibacter soopunensis]MDE2879263.1 choice-of-anchor B family protein [Candidatus Palauibacter soopunensis]